MSPDPSSDLTASTSGVEASSAAEAAAARQRVAEELAALGELEASPDEFALVSSGGGELSTSDDQRLVGEMFRISEALDKNDAELDELAQRRVWSVVDESASGRQGGAGAGRSKYWLGFVLASAAALALFVSRPGPADTTRGDNAEMAAAAHAGLQALGVDTGPGVDARRTMALAHSLDEATGRTLGEQG